jgi:hypothetical protein
MAVSVIGYILGTELVMSNSSSDKASESKRPQPDRSNGDTSNTDEPSAYYYDDATGYEIYEDEDDEENED